MWLASTLTFIFHKSVEAAGVPCGYASYIIALISVIVLNNIGDPSFIYNYWAIAEFEVSVAYDKLMFWVFSFDGSNPSSLLMCI